MQSAWRLAYLSVVFVAGCGGKDPAAGGLPPRDPQNDSDNVGGSTSPLTARIVRPNGSASIFAGAAVTLEAEFFYGGNALTPGTVTWQADGLFIGDTNPLTGVTFLAGSHTLSVSASYEGQQASDTTTVSVGDFEVRIVAPTDGARRDTGATVAFEGRARVMDGANAVVLVSGAPTAAERLASFAWSSSRDGALGSLSSFSSAALSVGVHVLTLEVRDDLTAGTGKSATASVSLEVLPPNTPPTVNISSPASCPVDLVEGETLALSGTVSDAEEPALAGQWTDSVTAAVTTGNSLQFGLGASLGKHELVFSAQDQAGARGRASCTVYVVPAGADRTALFPPTPAVNGNLPGGNLDVRWIGADAAGNTLIGTDEGLAVFDANNALVDQYSGTDLGVSGGTVRVNSVTVVATAAYVATESGLARCAYAAGVLSSCTQLEGADAAAASASDDGSLVLAALDGGLFVGVYLGATPVTSLVADPDNSNLPSDKVNDVLVIGNTGYVATDAGLCVISAPATAVATPNELCSTILEPDNSVLPSDEIRSLTADAGNVLWIGTSDGLVRYDTASGTMLVYGRSAGLANDKVNDVAIDSAGVLWIGTDGGLSRLDPATGAITNFNGADFGTPGQNRVRSVFIDAAGVKWLATELGVVRYVGE